MVVTPNPSDLEPSELAGQLEDRRQPTTTLEGWRRFVDAIDSATFTLLPNADWDALDDAARLEYDEARIAHHAELIVVTTSTIRQILKIGLEAQGFAVSLAPNAQEGMNIVVSDPPALVILDLNLPVLGGLEVCRLLRTRPGTAKTPRSDSLRATCSVA